VTRWFKLPVSTFFWGGVENECDYKTRKERKKTNEIKRNK
jgi:hypothetical protein